MNNKKSIADLAILGGSPLFDSIKSTSNLMAPSYDAFMAYSKSIFETKRLTNNGPLVIELEKRLKHLHNVEHCIVVCSGFMALLLVIKATAIVERSEIILPSLTYRRLDDIVRWAGFIPRFADVDPDSFGISAQTAKPHINQHTALIIGAHPIVHLCDIDGLQKLATQNAIPLIFDSVEAAYASHKGHMLGNFGDAEIFSMHASKLINAFEGGYITTNNTQLAQKLQRMRTFGFLHKDHIVELGTNAKLNELHAAMALGNLDLLEEQLEHNIQIHKAFQKWQKIIHGISVVMYNEQEKRSWKNILLHFGKEWTLTREQIINILHAENILVRPYYGTPLHKKTIYNNPSLPITERLSTEYLIMPSGAFVTEKDVEYMCNLMQLIYEDNAKLAQFSS